MKHIISESKHYLEPGVYPPWLYKVVQENVSVALAEDLPTEDPSTPTAISRASGEALIISNEAAVIAGRFWADEVLARMQTNISVEWHVEDGQPVDAKQQLCTVKGNLCAILHAERCVLNFLQTLSGTATVTARFAAQLGKNSKTLITDTRKTIPGLRMAQKYAVVCGGGTNHRFNLSDGILLKDNHIALHGSVAEAVAAMRRYSTDKPIEIEVRTLPQVRQAVAADVDVVMLDNFALADISTAVAIVAAKAKTEVSGNLKLEDIKTIADFGVDYISVGALTKHLCSIDMSMKVTQSKPKINEI